MLERFDIETRKNKETTFGIRRDLHSWLFDIEFSKERNDGESIMFAFSLKGIEDSEIGLSKSFDSRGSERPGAQ